MRPPAWLMLLVCLLALAGLRYWYGQLQTEQLLDRTDPLYAGNYRCVRTIEPLTIVVTGIDPLTSNGKTFPIRLAGIGPVAGETPDPSPDVILARLVPPDQTLRLEFDRERFDGDRIPLAYVLSKGRLVNAELVVAGVAVPDPLPGHSSPRQKQIDDALVDE